jgi:hypothetical protein
MCAIWAMHNQDPLSVVLLSLGHTGTGSNKATSCFQWLHITGSRRAHRLGPPACHGHGLAPYLPFSIVWVACAGSSSRRLWPAHLFGHQVLARQANGSHPCPSPCQWQAARSRGWRWSSCHCKVGTCRSMLLLVLLPLLHCVYMREWVQVLLALLRCIYEVLVLLPLLHCI